MKKQHDCFILLTFIRLQIIIITELYLQSLKLVTGDKIRNAVFSRIFLVTLPVKVLPGFQDIVECHLQSHF